ncbi:MAG: ROK family transcriptional regulator [Caldilineaceae bacterium]|nr:ROK family transcriptional regulator [Caldilineaceae bacterium]
MQTREKATHQQTRSHNKQLVLRTIFEEGQISRADIARRTGLTPVTVSQLAAELIDDDLVTQIDADVATPGRRGRNPVMLSMAADGRNLVALRIAVNEYRGAVLDLSGNMLYSRALDVGDERGDAAVLRIQELLDDVCQHATSPLLGIGVAAPGIVDTQRGVIHRSIFFDWNDLPLGARLQERYRQPVHVANASQVAALAEYLFGGGHASPNLAVVRVGQDVGVGLVLNGQLFFGDHYGAGELGHLVMEPDGELCRCGNRGCLETLVSRPALLRQAATLAAQQPDSAFARTLAAHPGHDLDAVLAAYQAGDPLAVQLADAAATNIGRALAGIVTLLNVRTILFVGSVTQFGEPWLETIRATLQHSAIPQLAEDTELGIAEHGPDAVILGAAALLLTRELGLAFHSRFAARL